MEILIKEERVGVEVIVVKNLVGMLVKKVRVIVKLDSLVLIKIAERVLVVKKKELLVLKVI